MKQKPIYRSPAGEKAVMAAYDRVLAQWDQATESIQVDTRQGRTHVLSQGDREASPLVLLHGAGSNALAWGADVPALARRLRVYAVDTPGEPGRSCHARIDWKGDGVVEWLEDVLEGLGHSRVALAGISQGGYVALRFAIARPDRVGALALLAPGGVTPVRPKFLLQALRYGLTGGAGAEKMMKHTLGADEIPQEARDYLQLIFTHFRSRTEPLPPVTDARLQGLSMPVMLMVGEQDALFDSAKTAARFENNVEGVQIRVMPHAGHALVGVASELAGFLEQVVAGPIAI